MHPRISLLTLGVSDVEKSARFYEKVFSVTRSSHTQEAVVFIQLHGIVLGLFGAEALAEDAGVPYEPGGFHGFSMSYNAASEQEVDEIFKRLKSEKVKIVKSPEKVFWGGYSGYFADPDGHLFEVAHNPFFERSADGELKV